MLSTPPSPRRRPLTAAAMILTVGLLAAGCSGGGSGSPTKRPGSSNGATSSSSGPTSSTTSPAATRLASSLAGWQLPAAVSRAAAIVEPDGIVVAGGLATGDVSTASVVRVDPRAGKASRIASLPLAVHDTAGAFLGGAAFVFGGGAATTVANVQRVAGTATSAAGALPKPRSDLAAATDGTHAYIAGGFDGHAMDADVLVTTNGTTFTRLGSLAVPVRYPAVALAGGALWVIGGQLSTAESTKTGGQSDAIQRIDLRTGRATIAGHLPTTLGHASAFSLGDQLFVAGGQVVTTPSARILRIDTGTGAVTDAGTLPGPRSDAAVAVVDGTAWLLGGETTDPAHPLATVVQIRSS